MKINSTNAVNPPPKFTPIKLEIIFESQTEADTFGALLNVSGVCDLDSICPGWNNFCNSIRRALDGQHLDTPASVAREYQGVLAILEKHFKRL